MRNLHHLRVRHEAHSTHHLWMWKHLRRRAISKLRILRNFIRKCIRGGVFLWII
ncbi:hypothetical protein R103_G31046 [Saccharomyces cerevisiae R103]|uniref:EC1118_1G1_2828p n=1 Tax=Saccharomyces cerevisiae (strain Lalvin EC1118 / Prise de mousse) TaxID=643680 RepID=C8Z8M9_YEAS8|nr:hypothetical protein R103_G31046 [Saccharomyces cerevisiae R103]KZV11212.1 hypothetical protein WN66_02392 [Saccharomyces cerevisiae]CAY79745.1 EC1118_1G1_2828p [Saccharomyces cerevisiae EC1118]